MDFAVKITLTTLIVALVMRVGHRFGGKVAGLLAGLPFTTVPALAWTGIERGSEVAAQASVGCIVGCSLVPLFAVAYDWAAQRLPPAATLGVGVLVLMAGVGLAGELETSLWPACALAVVACVAALRFMGGHASNASASALRPGLVLALTAISAGVLSALLTSQAVQISPRLAGLLAALPVVGGAAVVAEHAAIGPASVSAFLRGFVMSSLGKAAFGAVFALTVIPCGIVGATCLALLVGGVFCLIAYRIDQASRPRASIGHTASTVPSARPPRTAM